MDALTYLKNQADRCPFHELLGMKVVHLTVGTVTIEMPPNPKALNPGGTVHGGALFSLCDIAAGTAALTHGRNCVTQSANISYLSVGPADDTIVVKATELRFGRSVAVYNVTAVAKSTQTLVASGIFNMHYLSAPIPGIEHA